MSNPKKKRSSEEWENILALYDDKEQLEYTELEELVELEEILAASQQDAA